MDTVKAGVPGRPDVMRAVTDEDATVAVPGHPELLHRELHRLRVGFPAGLVGTTDHRVEPILEAERLENRPRQVALAVGDDSERSLGPVEEPAGVGVEGRRSGPGLGVLLLVKHRPERLDIDPPSPEEVVPGGLQPVPEPFDLVVVEVVVEACPHPVEDPMGVLELDIDERPVEVEETEIVGGVGHRSQCYGMIGLNPSGRGAIMDRLDGAAMGYHVLDPSRLTGDEDYPCTRRSITEAAGLANLAVALYELAPGEPLATDYHYHEHREEVFYVLAGELHVETPEGEFTVAPGEVFVVEPDSPIRPFNPEDAETSVEVLGLGAPLYDMGRPYEG